MFNTVIVWSAKRGKIRFASLLAVILSLGFTILLESTPANAQSLPQDCALNPDRATKGQWCKIPAFTDPIVAIHTTVLPNGKVLTWGASLANGNQTQAQLWNPDLPSTPPHPYTLDASFGNIFCSGHSLMSDGKLLITGGQEINVSDGYFTGISKAAKIL